MIEWFYGGARFRKIWLEDEVRDIQYYNRPQVLSLGRDMACAGDITFPLG